MRWGRMLFAAVALVAVLAGCSSSGNAKAIPIVSLSVPGGVPSDVSCPSATFCMATDVNAGFQAHGVTAWPVTPTGAQRPTQITGRNAPQGDVSCGSPSFCVLAYLVSKVSASVQAVAWDGRSWSAPVTLKDPTDQASEAWASCLPTNFCIVEDGAASWTDHNGQWSAPALLPGNDSSTGFGSIACVTEQRCVTVEPQATDVWDGSGWRRQAGVPLGRTVYIACPATTRCLTFGLAAKGALDETSTWDGTTWGKPVTVRGKDSLNDIQCPSLNLCVANDQSGRILTLTGAQWSTARPLVGGSPKPTGLAILSCPTVSRCFIPSPSRHAVISFEP